MMIVRAGGCYRDRNNYIYRAIVVSNKKVTLKPLTNITQYSFDVELPFFDVNYKPVTKIEEKFYIGHSS